jgi:hypothetical protein
MQPGNYLGSRIKGIFRVFLTERIIAFGNIPRSSKETLIY